MHSLLKFEINMFNDISKSLHISGDLQVTLPLSSCYPSGCTASMAIILGRSAPETSWFDLLRIPV